MRQCIGWMTTFAKEKLDSLGRVTPRAEHYDNFPLATLLTRPYALVCTVCVCVVVGVKVGTVIKLYRRSSDCT